MKWLILNLDRKVTGESPLSNVAEGLPCDSWTQAMKRRLRLAVLIDETDEMKDWLYAPLSDDRFAQVRSGSIDLYQAFRSGEDGFVHWVSVPIDGGSAIVRTIDCDALTNEMLPIAGERLSLEVAQVAW